MNNDIKLAFLQTYFRVKLSAINNTNYYDDRDLDNLDHLMNVYMDIERLEGLLDQKTKLEGAKR